MEVETAKKLLTVLANGINPITGEVLPETDSCNQVEIVRALYTVTEEIDKNIRGIAVRSRKIRVSDGPMPRTRN